MFLLCSIDGDADAEVIAVLLDEVLNGLLMVVDAVGGEGEAVAVEPVVVTAEKFRLDVIANLVDQFDFEERLAADEVPHHRLVGEIRVGFMVEQIINKGLGYLPRHAFFHVFANEVAVFAGQLAVLRDDEGDVLRCAGLPRFCFLYC